MGVLTPLQDNTLSSLSLLRCAFSLSSCCWQRSVWHWEGLSGGKPTQMRMLIPTGDMATTVAITVPATTGPATAATIRDTTTTTTTTTTIDQTPRLGTSSH